MLLLADDRDRYLAVLARDDCSRSRTQQIRRILQIVDERMALLDVEPVSLAVH